MARNFGLRSGVAIDEKLAAALLNPASKCTVRFIYSRGNATVCVSGMFVASIGAECEADRWLSEKADACPEIPNLRKWSDARKSA